CLLYSLLFFFSQFSAHPRDLHSFPTRRSSDLGRRYSCGGTYSRTDLGRKLSWHRDHHSFRRHFELSSQCAQQRRSHPRRRPGAVCCEKRRPQSCGLLQLPDDHEVALHLHVRQSCFKRARQPCDWQSQEKINGRGKQPDADVVVIRSGELPVHLGQFHHRNDGDQ